jgi:hypothetical protein
MASKKTNLPSVFLLLLSTLGILIGIFTAALTLASAYVFSTTSLSSAEEMSVLSTCILSISISILNVPTMITSIKKLRRKTVHQSLQPLLQKANYLIILWLLMLAVGYFISQEGSRTFLLAPLTVAAVIIPVWWLVEFSRRGLPRSTKLREWGTLTIGLTVTPIVIILIELILVVTAAVVVMIGLGLDPDLSSQLLSLLENINFYQNGIGELEQILYEMMKQPLISAAIFITIGLIVPLVEEIFKPMSTWFLLSRPLEEYEGFSLGLISGGAFAILESVGMVLQIDIQGWLIAITLRGATGVLHIGLSGLVGYGLARSWHQKRLGRGILYIITAAILHGTWNSLALFSVFSSSALSGEPGLETFGINGALSVFFMIIVFIGIIVITLKINSRLQHDLTASVEASP